jgi:hypothetical protein
MLCRQGISGSIGLASRLHARSRKMEPPDVAVIRFETAPRRFSWEGRFTSAVAIGPYPGNLAASPGSKAGIGFVGRRAAERCRNFARRRRSGSPQTVLEILRRIPGCSTIMSISNDPRKKDAFTAGATWRDVSGLRQAKRSRVLMQPPGSRGHFRLKRCFSPRRGERL